MAPYKKADGSWGCLSLELRDRNKPPAFYTPPPNRARLWLQWIVRLVFRR